MILPQTQEQLKKLNDYINQSVSLKHEKDTLDEDLSNIRDMVKEELDISTKDFNGLVKAAYDINKLESEIEERQSSITNLLTITGEKS